MQNMRISSISFLKSAAFALALIAVSFTACADVEDKIIRSCSVALGDQLGVAVDRGSIEIKTDDNNAVNIEVMSKAGGSRTKADKTLKDHVVTTTQSGNKVEIRAKYESEKTIGSFGNSPELQVSFVITVPRRF